MHSQKRSLSFVAYLFAHLTLMRTSSVSRKFLLQQFGRAKSCLPLHVLFSGIWSLLCLALISLHIFQRSHRASEQRFREIYIFQLEVKLFVTFLSLHNGKCQRLGQSTLTQLYIHPCN